MCFKDLSIMKERYGLDKRNTVVNVDILSGEKTTCEEAMRRITDLMKTTDKEGGKHCSYYINTPVGLMFVAKISNDSHM